MLLVRGVGDERVEVVGMAKNLHPVESACCTLPRDLGRINESVRVGQEAFVTSEAHQIKYSNVPILDIFGKKGQQSVYVSYVTDDKSFFRPKKRIVINLGAGKTASERSTDTIEVYLSINFASTSLHQFVEKNTAEHDWDTLWNICEDDNDLWVEDNTKVFVSEDDTFRENSLFDICGIQYDENRFSNALSYFIEKYTDLWQEFFSKQLEGVYEIAEIESVTREENAKVDSDKCKLPTGGRIDLLIRTKNSYIIIENKISSDIITKNGVTQLSRYYNYVCYLKSEELERLRKEKGQIEVYLEKRKEQFDKLTNKDGKRGIQWKNDMYTHKIELAKISAEEAKVMNLEIVGFVLAPDYNMPDESKLQIKDDNQKVRYTYNKLPYSEIYNWLKDNAADELSRDPNFKSFHDAMKLHIYDYESQSLYEEMKDTFLKRIKEIKKYSD